MNYDYLVSPIRVTVPSFKQGRDQSNVVFYTIELESNSNKWTLEKRFSQFDNLLKSLKNAFHNIPQLPDKKFFMKMTQKDLEQRRKSLQELLQLVVVRNDLMNSDQIKNFLKLDTNASQMMMYPPTLQFQYSIQGVNRGVSDFVYLEEQKIFYIATVDTSTMSRLGAKVTNTKMPWQNESNTKTFAQIGSIEAWACGDNSSKFVKVWGKGYPIEPVTISHDKATNKILVGLDDGLIDVVQVTSNGYEDIASFKAHQSRVTGVAFDALSNVVFSVSLDKVFRVSHGSSIALIVGIPHKQSIYHMLKDTLNKRLMFGTKLGEIYIYDISLAEKPKILATLQNHNKGSIRCLHLDTNRNYLFAAGYDDGEINVFEMDKPGREKYAKMTAFMKGKQKVTTIAWSAKRNEIITGTADGNITFWNAIDGKSIYVLQSFDTQITNLHYIESKLTLIISSKGRIIKVFILPKQWREAKRVADDEKQAKRRVIDRKKDVLTDALKKGAQDSDDDDLAGWHLE